MNAGGGPPSRKLVSAMTTDKAGGRSLRERMTPGRIAVLGLGVLALVFIFENTRSIKIRLLISEVTMQ
jgi:hypothetical protein